MDSKHRPDEEAEELPPPYSISSPSYLGDQTSPNDITSLLQQHLASLPTRIRMTREAHSVQQSLDDASIVDLLLPKIHDYLAYLGSLHPTPKLAHLTLIPEAAVPPNAVLSGMDEMRRRGESCEVARVRLDLGGGSSDEKKGAGAEAGSSNITQTTTATSSENWSVGREFSDWGRFGDSPSSTSDASRSGGLLWWNDEDMARRLARHLQPTAAPAEQSVPAVQSSVQAAVEARIPAQKEKEKEVKPGWAVSRLSERFRRSGNTPTSTSTSTYATKTVQREVDSFPGRPGESPLSPHARDKKSVQERRNNGKGAKMSVTAEEVAFRSENDFGLMESVRGWAVVVVVRVRT
ncbi:hypothetical protein F5Y08DRAFT_63878 [Xylaria arbuscula]|nr:hypothetical protein F5Y08DRAFT_63878 [Xylaria arbuscula]